MNRTVVYCVPDAGPFILSNVSDPLVFEKELIHAGKFIKAGKPFAITEQALHHWQRTHAQMLSNGLTVPTPVEHTEDPEKRRGSITEMRVGVNKKGLAALFGKFKFNDAEAARLASSADVSIFVPPHIVDGKGNEYTSPIKHVAFTDYPVIPGLEPFSPLAASLYTGAFAMDEEDLMDGEVGDDDEAAEGESEGTSLQSLAARLGIDVQGMDDQGIEDSIVELFDELTQEDAAENSAVNMPGPVAASFTRLLKENRENKLRGLVSAGHLNKAACDRLVAKHCEETALQLSFADDAADEDFDALIGALSLNTAYRPGEKTSVQELGNAELLGETNPLLKDAAKRTA